jgi:hypothetical protein
VVTGVKCIPQLRIKGWSKGHKGKTKAVRYWEGERQGRYENKIAHVKKQEVGKHRW